MVHLLKNLCRLEGHDLTFNPTLYSSYVSFQLFSSIFDKTENGLAAATAGSSGVAQEHAS